MAKKSELKERGTGEVVYPLTAQECILTRDGSGVPSKKEVENKLAAFVESTPDYLSVLDSLKTRLKENPDEALALTEEITEAKKALFIDLWNYACMGFGKYNEETGLFELNGLTDLTYEEAIQIYYIESISFIYPYRYAYGINVRTNLPYNISSGSPTDISRIMYANDTIEVLNLFCRRVNGKYDGKMSLAPFSSHSYIQNARKVRMVLGILDVSNVKDTNIAKIIYDMPLLEEIQLYGVKNSHQFVNAPKISLPSFRYLVENSANTEEIVLTIHPNIYNALLGIDIEYPFNGGTKEEWEQLLADATAKNISFATV